MTLSAKEMILVFGIRRSGNHLISDWLIHQYLDPCFQAMNVQLDFFYFLDDCETKCSLYNCALFGIEEHPVSAVDIAYSKNAQTVRKVVILRDPYNLFASRIKHYKLFEAPLFNGPFATYNWVGYANYFLNQPENVVCISYNHFITDKNYREQITEKLGVDLNSAKDLKYMNSVDSSISGGSSFDGKRYDGAGAQMKITQRWEYYKDNANYRALFTDEIKELSKEIFDFRPF
jgi:hypothetical protein